jgi:hypothetical protein
MIADLLEEALVASGYEVCGIARTVCNARTDNSLGSCPDEWCRSCG